MKNPTSETGQIVVGDLLHFPSEYLLYTSDSPDMWQHEDHQTPIDASRINVCGGGFNIRHEDRRLQQPMHGDAIRPLVSGLRADLPVYLVVDGESQPATVKTDRYRVVIVPLR